MEESKVAAKCRDRDLKIISKMIVDATKVNAAKS